MGRPLRIQFGGAVYHLVVGASHRQALFRDNHDRRRYLQLLSRYKDQFSIKIYAYLLTWRRVDLLVETARGNLARLMQCLGTSYAGYFNRRYGRTGPLFQGRYKSYLVDKEVSLLEATRCIHLKDFRLGVKRRRDYAWSSYRLYARRDSSDLVDIDPVLSRFGDDFEEQRKRYRDFVEKGKRGVKAYFGQLASPQNYNPFGALSRDSFQKQPRKVEDERPFTAAERIFLQLSRCLGPVKSFDLSEAKKRRLFRHLGMYLLRKHTDLSLRSIGEIFGVKPPAVALGIAKVEQLMREAGLPPEVKELLLRGTFLFPESIDAYSCPER